VAWRRGGSPDSLLVMDAQRNRRDDPEVNREQILLLVICAVAFGGVVVAAIWMGAF
jgi:hypothetical protein